MVIVNVKDKKFYMDAYLKQNIDYVKSVLQKRNETFIGLIDGRIGSGKSTVVDQWAYYCTDGNFSLDDKAFTVEKFRDLLNSKKKGQKDNCVILDEGFELNKRKTQSEANMTILRQLQRIRSKNLWIWIVLPCVYDLDKNVILHLANLFVHCYKKGDFGRKGNFKIYDSDRLKWLWLKCRDHLSYSDKMVTPNFYGRFTQRFPSSDYDIYEKVKNRDLDELEEKLKKKDKPIKYKEQRNELIVGMKKEGMHVDKICKMVGLKKRSVYDVLEKYGVETKQ